MPTLTTLSTPPIDAPCAVRVEWAGERLVDLADGTLPKSAAPMIWNYLVGWCDLATEDERRQYLALARSVEEMGRAS